MDWRQFIRSNLSEDIWGAIALDYFSKMHVPNPELEVQTPGQYIEWIIGQIYEPGMDIVEFHRVFLGVCVRLLGHNFDAIIEHSIRLLNVAFPHGIDGGTLSQVANHFQGYGMQENFMQRLKQDRFQVQTSETTETTPMLESSQAILKDWERRTTWNKVQIAIITVLQEEYEAVLAQLDHHDYYEGSRKRRNTCAWQLGIVKKDGSSEAYRVVVALVGKGRNLSSASVTRETLERWKPGYVLLVGIAGGVNRGGVAKGDEEVAKGDVVVSSIIVGYEPGKMTKEFKPRDELTYQTSSSLQRAAQVLSSVQQDWAKNILKSPPELSTSKLHLGQVASGEKVVDDLTNVFMQKVTEHWPKLVAIETEGVGAAHIIHEEADKGIATSFLMIRGISDIPIFKGSAELRDANAQTLERDSWKKYASSAAACFAIQMVRYVWPENPRKV